MVKGVEAENVGSLTVTANKAAKGSKPFRGTMVGAARGIWWLFDLDWRAPVGPEEHSAAVGEKHPSVLESDTLLRLFRVDTSQCARRQIVGPK
jgi:hypothetical protein